MRTTRSWLLLALLLALALFAAGCGDDGGDDGGDSKGAKTSGSESGGGGGEDEDEQKGSPDEKFTIQVHDGRVVGGPQSMKAKVGDHVRIEILSDAADELHLHGIDVEVEVPQGRPAVMGFTVESQGSYELEMHEAGIVVGAVVVS